MALRIAINGFGRIGRNVFRVVHQNHPDVEIVSLNDLTSTETVYTLRSDGGELDGASLVHIAAIDLDVGYRLLKRYRILETDPLSAQTELASMALLRRGDWRVRVECRTRLTATAEAFQFGCDLECFEGDQLVFERSWNVAIPRQLL